MHSAQAITSKKRRSNATEVRRKLVSSLKRKGLESTLSEIHTEIYRYCKGASVFPERNPRYFKRNTDLYEVVKGIYLLGVRQGKSLKAKRTTTLAG